jgi:hypothetical protein
MTINLAVDPERAAALITKARSFPGVASAGWTSGVVDMDRTVRFAASGWREGPTLNREKLATAISSVAANTFSAKLASSRWNEDTGKLTLILKRGSATFPSLALTDVIEINALVSPDRPLNADHLMLWIGAPSITTVDEATSDKLGLIDNSSDDEEGDQGDDFGIVDALAKEFKGQRWDIENSAWK